MLCTSSWYGIKCIRRVRIKMKVATVDAGDETNMQSQEKSKIWGGERLKTREIPGVYSKKKNKLCSYATSSPKSCIGSKEWSESSLHTSNTCNITLVQKKRKYITLKRIQFSMCVASTKSQKKELNDGVDTDVYNSCATYLVLVECKY